MPMGNFEVMTCSSDVHKAGNVGLSADVSSELGGTAEDEVVVRSVVEEVGCMSKETESGG